MGKLQTKVELTMLKPIEQVYSAVLNPQPFFVEKASGPIQAGKKISWKFPDFDMQLEIHGEKTIPNEMICFKWMGMDGEFNTVTFEFRRFEKDATTVAVAEEGWPETDGGRASSLRNTAGWMHMLCSLKAFLEHRVNLRTGSFAHMKGQIPED